MNLKDFYYDLPPELIAQKPLTDRSASRLLVLKKDTGERQAMTFKDIVNIIEPGSCLVLNDTKVIPARLFGERKDTRGKVEILLLKRIDANNWEIICKPGKKARKGSQLVFADGMLEGEISNVLPNGNRVVTFKYDGVFEHILDRLGEMPLPPYITERLEDKNRYQTVFAKNDGSSAAPTAGLHFTGELLERLRQKGVRIAKITLHVGLGTFRPVKTENIEEHEMHSESFIIEKSQADIINDTKKNGGKIIAVGTTSCRALESCADPEGYVQPATKDTNIFIYPGYKFKVVDNLITNFHLPESTLIMLVSALAGYENTMNAYKAAVSDGYRFFSFGDAMFIGDTTPNSNK